MNNSSLRNIFLLSLFIVPASVFSQGSLTPPAAPAPTMKTLDQLEPRTPISSLPFAISLPGVYYLTKNITTTGDGIQIDADDVVVDLGGFTLSGDGGAGDIGVDITGQSRVIVRNGTVRNFSIGVSLSLGTSEALVEDVILAGNLTAGLNAPANASNRLFRSVIRRVRAVSNTGAGFLIGTAAGAESGLNIIDRCEAIDNGNIGFSIALLGNLVVHCVASGNGGAGNYAIGANNRGGEYVVPPVNTSFSGSAGGPGSGTTDPFANISF